MKQMVNLTIGPQCRFLLTNATETFFAIDHVIVQTGGYMSTVRDDNQDVTFRGVTFDIRGGGKVMIQWVAQFPFWELALYPVLVCVCVCVCGVIYLAHPGLVI